MRTATASSLSRFVRSLVLALVLLGAASASSASVFVSVNFAPPPLPVYEQPLCPGPGYIWVPGYWAWGPDGYYWVPGTWVFAPFIGALWTPGYWAFTGVVYVWHPGYWGRHVGFYGGIDYGFGYFGIGYAGGYWSGRSFYYNTAVTHVDVTTVHNTYNRFVQNVNVTRVSFNGGPGGTTARPTAQDRIAEREAHRAPTPVQVQHERLASRDRSLFAAVNHGSPPIAATTRAGAFGRSELRGRAAGANAPQTAPSHVARAPRSEAERAFGSRGGREVGPQSAARGGTAEREHRAPQAAAPRTQQRPEMHAQERARAQAAPRTESKPEMHAQERPRAQAAPRTESRPPRTEMHAQERARPQAAPRIESRPEMHAQERPHPQAAPRMEARPEMRAQERPQAAPRMEPRREARVPSMERPQAPPQRQAPEMRAQNMPRPQAAPHPQPRPEMHAQGQPREGRGGEGRREEQRGGG